MFSDNNNQLNHLERNQQTGELRSDRLVSKEKRIKILKNRQEID